MKLVQHIKEWLFKITHTKCDYCNTPKCSKELNYSETLPLKIFKGDNICDDCYINNAYHDIK